MYGSPKVPERIQMSSFNVEPFRSLLTPSRRGVVEPSKPSLRIDVDKIVDQDIQQPRSARVAYDAALACDSMEAKIARKLVMQEHLASRVKTLRDVKQHASLYQWWLTRLANDQSHEQSLYWKLIFTTPTMSIDRYAFQLADYHCEYQSKKHAANCSEQCKQPGRCVVEGNPSPCQDCSWLQVQTDWCEQFIAERSALSDNYYIVDAFYYVCAAVIPSLKRVLSENTKLLHIIQELSCQSFGYVYSTQTIKEYFTKWHYRLMFASLGILVQFSTVILYPMVEVDWKITPWPRVFRFDGNTQVETFLALALMVGTGVLLSVVVAITPQMRLPNRRSIWMQK